MLERSLGHDGDGLRRIIRIEDDLQPLIGVRRLTRHGGDDHHLVGPRSEDGVQAPGDPGADCAQG